MNLFNKNRAKTKNQTYNHLKQQIMKQKILLMAINILSTFFVTAQVTVTDNTTLSLGSENIVGTSDVGKYAQASGMDFGSYNGLNIEFGNGESAGIHFDDNKVVIWSAGDENLVNFCDEDNMEYYGSSYQQAVIAYIDGSGYYYQISDSTSKEQIRIINSPLLKVMQLRGVEYYHKNKMVNATNKTGDNSQAVNKKIDKEKKTGFLAQEVEAIIPEAVSTNKAGVKYVNYQAVIPFLVEAIKEQESKISTQAQHIVELQRQIDEIQKILKIRKLK